MSCSIITVKNASKKPKYAHRSRSYHNPKVIKSENFEHGFEKNKVEICNIEKNPFYLQQKSRFKLSKKIKNNVFIKVYISLIY